MFPHTRQTIGSRIFVCMALAVSFTAGPLNAAQAQGRGAKGSGATSTPASASASGPASGAGGLDGAAEASSDKLDVSGLEKKYWAAKDTDFSVVQNRTYSKVNRFSVSGQYGMMINDPVYDAEALNVSGSYYFSERYGLELSFTKFTPTSNKQTEYFRTVYATVPDHGEIRNFYGASFNWVPIYAKVSLLNTKIIYFDMAFSPGVGMTQYDAKVSTGDIAKNAPTLTFDVSQQFFLGKHFVFRFDYKNRWFQEDILFFNRTGQTGQKSKTDLNQSSLFLFGLTFFY
jgi:outer membrane beta-barrel protein